MTNVTNERPGHVAKHEAEPSSLSDQRPENSSKIKTLQFDFANPPSELIINFRNFFTWLLWTDCSDQDAIEELTGFLLAIRSLESANDVEDFCYHAIQALFTLTTDHDK